MGVSDTTEQDWEEYYSKQLDDTIVVHTNGLEEGIRCAICTNGIKTNLGCDGGCVVDNRLLKNIMNVIELNMVK